MRKTITQLLQGVPEVLSWHASGSLDEAPARPFGTFRLALTQPGLTVRSPIRPVSLEVWVHDDKGSYLRIDRILDSVEQVFGEVTGVSADPKEFISHADFGSRSPDLNDDSLGTACRMSNFTLIGRGQ